MDKQITLYDLTRSNYKIKNKIRLIELFAGIGSQAKALKNLGADFETWKVVEFDRDKYTYIMTYSFPCQDLSVAGHRKGMEKGKGTRSGLLWEVERLLNEVENLPQVLLMENVPMVHSKDNIGEFTEWIEFLRSKGYSNFWQDLNAKDYGVAQNRDRCFMVSILGEWNYNFPDPIPLTKCMKDYLEETVDEKFYINSPKAQKLIDMLLADGVEPNQAVDGTLGNPRPKEVASSIIARYDAGIQNKPKWGTMYFEKCDPVILTGMGSESDDREPGIRKTDVATTLLARDYKGLDNYGSNGVLQLVGQMDNSDGTHESQNRVYSPGGLAPTITTQSGGNLQPKTLECKAVGHIEHGTGRHQSNTVYSDNGLSPTLTTIENGGTQQIKVIGNYMPGEHEAGRVVDENGLCPTVKENHGTTTATVVKDNRTSIYSLLLDIFDLCGIIDEKEEEKYERSRALLQVLWQEIGKKEIWQEIGGQNRLQQAEILQPTMYEYGFLEDRESQSTLQIGTCDSGKHNEKLEDRTQMLNMWEDWKVRYTPHKWELSGQQYRELNLFVQKLSHETAQPKAEVQDLWCANERVGVLQQTLHKIQEIWRPAVYKNQSELRIRKLTPRETWRLMDFDDEDYDKAAKVNSQTQLYKQAGNSIVVGVLEAILGEML